MINMAKVCIICQKGISGNAAKVKNDGVIDAIRKIKNALKVAQNNELYVCNADMQAYADRRKKFEKDVVAYGVLALAVVIMLVGLPLLGGKFDIIVLIYSLLLGTIVFVLGAMIKYVPAIEKITVQPTEKIEVPTKKKTVLKTVAKKKVK